MKERLLQLLDMEQLTPSKFADIIGVQRSSVSHVISGRNNPSFDFLQKTLKAFPGLKADWLMLGEGTMYEQMGRVNTGNLFDTEDNRESSVVQSTHESEETAGHEEGAIRTQAHTPMERTTEKKQVEITDKEADTREIVKVILFYSDDTFVSFEPS